jgi:kinesin family protein 11
LLASDISHKFPFSTLERKDKIEEGNRVLIQKFQSQLAQQLEALHKTVSASVMHQEQQLKDMEKDMQSFVSTKSEVCFQKTQLHLLVKLQFSDLMTSI